MKIELIEEQTFSARAGAQLVRGLHVTGEWEGMRKLMDGKGRHLIVDGDGTVLKGAPELLHALQLTVGGDDAFAIVPETTLPNGHVVPAFRVARHACSKDADGRATVSADGVPWVNIRFADAKAEAGAAGMALITELQYLAIAHQIWHQDENWTGGQVGQGKLYQGLHRDSVNSPQASTYESKHEQERRWHALANGERVYDFAGNVFTWVFDDVQGDDKGLVSGKIAVDSPSLKTAPDGCYEKGGGYIPEGPLSWSGLVLVRGGCWCSRGHAGVFDLRNGWPDGDDNRVGFRCTKGL